MTFDERLSESVSLSKILDCFIEDRESPDIILSFLKEHECYIKDIIDCSECSARLFSLDFIKRCSFPQMIEVRKFFEKFEDDTSYLVWQILQSDMPNNTKRFFRSYLSMIKPKKHPYAGKLSSVYIQTFDKIFIDTDDIDCVVDKINSIPNNTFEDLVKNIDYSLFRERIYQRDMFCGFSIEKQYILIKALSRYGICKWTVKFTKQILNSGIDVEVKYELFKTIENSMRFVDSYDIMLPDEIIELVNLSQNFSQMMLKLNLYGIDTFGSELIFYLLLTDSGRLNELIEYDRQFVIDNFNICDLVERMGK